MRWFPVSATATTLVFVGLAFLLTATSSGDKSSPSPEPSEPNTLSGVPVQFSTQTRWLPVSATKTVPSLCMAIPLGDEKFGSTAGGGGGVGGSCVASMPTGAAWAWASPAADTASASTVNAAAPTTNGAEGTNGNEGVAQRLGYKPSSRVGQAEGMSSSP